MMVTESATEDEAMEGAAMVVVARVMAAMREEMVEARRRARTHT